MYFRGKIEEYVMRGQVVYSDCLNKFKINHKAASAIEDLQKWMADYNDLVKKPEVSTTKWCPSWSQWNNRQIRQVRRPEVNRRQRIKQEMEEKLGAVERILIDSTKNPQTSKRC